MKKVDNDICAKIVEVLNTIDVKYLKRLAKHDVAIKSTLELVDVCKKSLASTKKKKTSWLNVARALAKRIISYDPLCINFEDKKRKDGTWCMWLTWKDMTIKTAGYSLVSENANSSRHEDAAKSFVENFCYVGPYCLKIFNSPYTHVNQRRANVAIVAVYKELDCPKTAKDVYAKLLLRK